MPRDVDSDGWGNTYRIIKLTKHNIDHYQQILTDQINFDSFEDED